MYTVTATSAGAVDTACPLLDLPPELRNRIFEMLGTQPVQIDVHLKQPPILLVCRQVRMEAVKFGALMTSRSRCWTATIRCFDNFGAIGTR